MKLLLIKSVTEAASVISEDGVIHFQEQSEAQGILNPVAMLMGNDCNILSAPMPTKQARQIVKALPFAMEELLANDVESNHLHYIGRSNGQAHALTIQHSVIKNIIELHAPTKLFYLPMLLPIGPDNISVLIIEDNACVRINEYSAFSVPVDFLPLALEKHLSQDEGKQNVIISYAGDKLELLELQLENLGLGIEQKEFSEVLQYIQSQTLMTANNLLSGQYQLKASGDKKSNSKIKAVITLAACLFALIISINLITASQQTNLAGLVKAASKEFYLKLFPGERVRGIKRQFAEKLDNNTATAQGSAGFTQILAITAGEIRQNKSAEIHAVRFTAKKGTLEISIITENVAQLDGIKKKLEQKNLSVEIASANNDGKRIKGLLKVSKNG
ncbi:MAG: type II secretion system protein GspL [Bermanella sp.]